MTADHAADAVPPLVNEPQFRHFAVFLSMLETALNEVHNLSSDGHASRRVKALLTAELVR